MTCKVCSKPDIWVCAYRFQFSPWQSFSFLCCPFSLSSVDERNWWAAESTRSFHCLPGNGGAIPLLLGGTARGSDGSSVAGCCLHLVLWPCPCPCVCPSSASGASYAFAPKVSSQCESLLSSLFHPCTDKSLLLAYSPSWLENELASSKDNSSGFTVHVDRNKWHEWCLYRAANVQVKQENLNPPVELD